MITGLVEIIDHMGSDLTVVNAARVSFSKISKWEERTISSHEGYEDIEYVLSDKDKKLISYLAKHGHWTPFAHPQITLHIKAPMPIRTQFFKHKVGFVENEISRRYVDEDPTFFEPLYWSERPKNAKQGAGDSVTDDVQNRAHCVYNLALQQASDAYKSLLNMGIAPEQARFILPQATFTEWYWTGSLAAYARFYMQRSAPHAQAEIREYAHYIGSIIQPYFPVSWEALTNNGVIPE